MTIEYEKYRILKVPSTAFYIPNFITAEEEIQITKNIYSVPKPKWTCLSNRRLQDWGGVPHKNGMITEKIPEWLIVYVDKIKKLNIYPSDRQPNHVLINEYLSGQGIMPHTDGPLFFPIVTTISCSSHTVLEFKKDEIGDMFKFKLLLEPRSLLILKDELYTKYLHSISEFNCDVIDNDYMNLELCDNKYIVRDKLNRDTRISVTIRNVPKVAKIKLF